MQRSFPQDVEQLIDQLQHLKREFDMSLKNGGNYKEIEAIHNQIRELCAVIYKLEKEAEENNTN